MNWPANTPTHEAPPTPLWHPCLVTVPANVSAAFIVIPPHVPSLISVWVQLPTEPQPGGGVGGGGPGWMERPRLRWAAEQLRTHTKRNSISILTSTHSSALFFLIFFSPLQLPLQRSTTERCQRACGVNKASVHHTDKRMFDPIPSRQH